MSKIQRLLVPLAGVVMAIVVSGTASAQGLVKPLCDITYGSTITGVGNPYTTYGGWNFATQGACSSTAISCQLSYDKTLGYSNSVSGTVTVGDPTISSAVGFDVTYSSSSTASYSVTFRPPTTQETIYWRDVYSTRAVYQQDEYRYVCGGQWIKYGPTYTAYAHKWLGFGFKSVGS